jgi:hypothetical protein
MLQYPVPQFTEVEDKIIGPLTIRQFGILFGAGMFIFLLFSATKSIIVLIVLSLFIGLPAVFLAFAKPNGRPLYRSIGSFVKFFTSPKLLIFHKESETLSSRSKLTNISIESETAAKDILPKEDTHARLKKLNRLLEQQAAEEVKMIRRK